LVAVNSFGGASTHADAYIARISPDLTALLSSLDADELFRRLDWRRLGADLLIVHFEL
jgi:hypothetical protein